MKRPVRKVQPDDPIPSVRVVAEPSPKLAPVESPIETFDVEQGAFCGEERSCRRDCEAGPCWYRIKLGIPSASNFSKIVAKSEERAGRARYMRQLAGEILTGVPAETFSNAHMQRGKEMEAEIRGDYAFEREVELRSVGFARRALQRGRFVGCSPDSLVGDDGVLEVKTMLPELMIELAESGRFPNEHRAQCVGALWVTGRAWCDLRVGYRGMPLSLTWRVLRAENEAFVREIADALEVFHYELNALVERMRKKGRG